MPDHLPQFIDFEASSLGEGSYPIEVAWSTNDGQIHEYLISPATIDSWTDWDSDSQAVHGISRECLLSNGVNPSVVCEAICGSLSDNVLYSDGQPFDEKWLRMLLAAAGRDATQIRVISIARLPYIDALDRNTRDRLSKKARDRVDGQHRARVDVEYLVQYFKLARRACGFE